MNFIFANNMSNFVKNELNKIQELILPLLKKNSRYMIWALPLIGVSVINLFLMLFFTPSSEGTAIMIGVYALFGAIGMALSKESKINKKKIQQISIEYITERIQQSHYVSDERQKQFINSLHEQPVKFMNTFIQFLKEEETIMERNGSVFSG